MKTKDELKQERIITPVGTVAFCKNLFEANAKGRYTICVMFDKDQAEELSSLKELTNNWIKATWGDKKPSKLFTPMKVEDREEMIEKYPFMEDKIILNASNGFIPGIIDKHGKDLFNGDIKAGDKVKLSISAYSYDNNSKGVGFNVNGVQLWEKGEALYARTSTAEMFGVTPAPMKEVNEEGNFDEFGF